MKPELLQPGLGRESLEEIAMVALESPAYNSLPTVTSASIAAARGLLGSSKGLAASHARHAAARGEN